MEKFPDMPVTHNEEMENTPFRIVGNDEHGYCVTIGKYAITQPTASPAEAQEKLHTNFWHVLLNILMIAPELIKEIKDALQTKPLAPEIPNIPD